MPFHRAFYSIIQYCPDRGRAEAANIGVLLLCPELGFVNAKTAVGHQRVRRFFGRASFDPARLRLAKRAIETRVREKYDWSEGLTDLERFIETRANDIQLTPARTMKTENPAADLEALFRDVVGGVARSERTKQPAGFARLDERLRTPELKDRIRFGETVRVPVLGKELSIPYSYENGTTKLVKPHLFKGSPENIVRHASELAVDGDLVRRHSETRPKQLIVLPAFSDEARPMAEQVGRLFHEYQVRVVDEDAIDEFIAEVAHTAH